MNPPRPSTRGRMRYDWWRAHHGLPSHPKWRAVARAAQVPVSVAFHVACCLLDVASRGHPRGSIGEFRAFDCAGVVDVTVDKVDGVLKVLREQHWIEGHMIAEWDARQPQREDAGAAVRKAGERMRDKLLCHASDAGHGVTNGFVTNVSAPDRDKKITSSEYVAARATLVDKSMEGEQKRPCDISRIELDALLAAKKATAS